MYKILIVEDDLQIANAMAIQLKKWGHEVLCIQDYKDIMTPFIQYEPQLVLLDINLPFASGYHWCSEIRNSSKVPIIFISSTSEDLNVVMAMNIGADDFIAKPFDLNVLVAKVNALLRRTYSFNEQTHLLTHKKVILNLNDASLTYQSQRTDLTKNESKIIQILVENNGSIVSRDQIMMQLWQSNEFIDDNTLTVNITRLRKKLQEIGLDAFITTKKGLGYMVE